MGTNMSPEKLKIYHENIAKKRKEITENKPFISEENGKFFIKKKWFGGIVLAKYQYLQNGWYRNDYRYPYEQFDSYEEAEKRLKDILENGCIELT
jgi:hypothetical protein